MIQRKKGDLKIIIETEVDLVLMMARKKFKMQKGIEKQVILIPPMIKEAQNLKNKKLHLREQLKRLKIIIKIKAAEAEVIAVRAVEVDLIPLRNVRSIEMLRIDLLN